MAECMIVKTDKPNLFMAMDDALQSIQPGEVLKVKYSKVRNPRFHNKGMKLFRFVFDALPDPNQVSYRGALITPLKDFDTVRKELTIKAGFYEIVGKIDGSVKLEAKSLSFSSMEEDEFKKVYSALIDVALQVLPYTMTGQELDRAVETLMVGYA